MYRLLITLLLPLFFIYTLKTAVKFKSLRYLKQRLGFSYPALSSQPIWLHCASVGEVNAVLPLLERLIERLPHQMFLITTNTVTGAEILQKNKLNNTVHCYLPLENNFVIKKFLSRTQPEIALIMETEIWPLLYQLISNRHIPINIINARLSDKTINAYSWIKQQYGYALQLVDNILARSEQDMNLYKELGGNANKIKVIGNIKFSQALHSKNKPLNNFTSREYILAASTHNDEEVQLAALCTTLKSHNALLVIAPRHPHRSDSIVKQLSPLNVNISVRSNSDAINEDTDIYLADTLGELSAFMQTAKVVFMGGSLIPHGGQNLLEAAQLGKAIIVGPHMHNFQNEVALFKQHHACIQIQNINELDKTVEILLTDNNKRSSLEHSARQLMLEQSGVVDLYLQELELNYPAIFKPQNTEPV